MPHARHLRGRDCLFGCRYGFLRISADETPQGSAYSDWTGFADCPAVSKRDQANPINSAGAAR